MHATENLRLLKHASIENKQAEASKLKEARKPYIHGKNNTNDFTTFSKNDPQNFKNPKSQ